MFEIPKVPYSEFVAALVKPGQAILDNLDAKKVDLMHAGIGICGEAGELLDAVKRYTIYGKEADYKNIEEELGDIEFYLEQFRQNVGITREQALAANRKKLWERYQGAYSDRKAIERADKAGEQ